VRRRLIKALDFLGLSVLELLELKIDRLESNSVWN